MICGGACLQMMQHIGACHEGRLVGAEVQEWMVSDWPLRELPLEGAGAERGLKAVKGGDLEERMARSNRAESIRAALAKLMAAGLDEFEALEAQAMDGWMQAWQDAEDKQVGADLPACLFGSPHKCSKMNH